MSFLITSDIHMNDKPTDAYRWELFPWLETQAHNLKVSDIIILGDYTDAKDRHSAKLVNKMADNLTEMSQNCIVHMLIANHDYIDPEYPFWEFCRYQQNVRVYVEPQQVQLHSGHLALFLPSTKNPQDDWKSFDFNAFSYIFCHQTFTGALSQNGTVLQGVPKDIFGKTKAKIYSGDIHAPGTVGPIEYVGAPYHTDFGCAYIPRVIHIDNSLRAHSLHTPFPRRFTLTISSCRDLDGYTSTVNKDDQVKVRVKLRREDLHEYAELRERARQVCTQYGWQVCGFELDKLASAERSDLTPTTGYLTAEQRVRQFAEKHELSKDLEALGVSLLHQD